MTPRDLDVEDTPAMRALAGLVTAAEMLFPFSYEDLDAILEALDEGGAAVGGCVNSELRELVQAVKDEKEAMTGCRRCTECEGEDHHWMVDSTEKRPEPFGACKHCDYTCATVECSVCEQIVPIDLAMRSHCHSDHICQNCLTPKRDGAT